MGGFLYACPHYSADTDESEDRFKRMKHLVIGMVAAVLAGALMVACGGGGSSGSSTTVTGFANTSISDPATCQTPNGPYSHVYVTVKDVNSGSVDFTPKMNPVQVDLVGQPDVNCFLATLGSQAQIPAGSYQQIGIVLADNNSGGTVTGNKCQGTDANCVVLAVDNSVHTIQLSSEAQTGIKIASGQIAGGQFTVAENQTVNLNLDFDCCASIVITSNGQYRLKPVLHAGTVSTPPSSISGTVVDSGTNLPIPGAKVMVALEQKDANGIDRVIMETIADFQGNFKFCPVPSGTYDVVANALSGGVAYAATVTTGVGSGVSMGNIPLVATTGVNTGPATIMGRVTTSTGTAATAADTQLAALQSIGAGTMATIPLIAQSSTTASLATAANGACPVNTDCVNYTILVPAVNPNIGAFVAGNTKWSQDTKSAATYTLDALAFGVSSGGTPDCSPSQQQVGPVTVTPGTTVNPNPADLVFKGCQ